jgi:hypothetical protein
MTPAKRGVRLFPAFRVLYVWIHDGGLDRRARVIPEARRLDFIERIGAHKKSSTIMSFVAPFSSRSASALEYLRGRGRSSQIKLK